MKVKLNAPSHMNFFRKWISERNLFKVHTKKNMHTNFSYTNLHWIRVYYLWLNKLSGRCTIWSSCFRITRNLMYLVCFQLFLVDFFKYNAKKCSLIFFNVAFYLHVFLIYFLNAYPCIGNKGVEIRNKELTLRKTLACISYFGSSYFMDVALTKSPKLPWLVFHLFIFHFY